MKIKFFVILLSIFFLFGCQTTPKVSGPGESQEDVEEVLSAVAGALSGKQLSEEELQDLEDQIRTDEEAQSAIQVITDSIGGKAAEVKYCPITGRRYAPHLEICPEHQVKLEIVDE